MFVCMYSLAVANAVLFVLHGVPRSLELLATTPQPQLNHQTPHSTSSADRSPKIVINRA